MSQIHKFELLTTRDRTIVFDAETLALFEVDEECRRYLAQAERDGNPNRNVRRCLEAAGFYEETAQLQTPARNSIEAFRVVLTESCNLDCPDCFAASHRSQLRTMTPTVLNQVVDKACDLARGSRFRFHFFGGEPLLCKELIRAGVVAIERKSQQGFLEPVLSITTNLTLLDQETAELFANHHFKVGVSVDGHEELHDSFRPYQNGLGTFSDVKRNYEMLLELGVETFILITPHHQSSTSLVDNFGYLVEAFPTKEVTINTPFHKTHYGWNVDGGSYAEELMSVERKALALDVSVDSALTPPVSAICNAEPRLSACSAYGRSVMYSIAPDGSVSSCPQNWQRTLPLDNAEECEDMGRFDISCRGCIARKICGGPCHIFQRFSGSRVDPARCEFMRSIPGLIMRNLDLFGDESQ